MTPRPLSMLIAGALALAVAASSRDQSLAAQGNTTAASRPQGGCSDPEISEILRRLNDSPPSGHERFYVVDQFYGGTAGLRQTCTDPSFWKTTLVNLRSGAQPGSLREAINAVNDAGNASATMKISTPNFFTTPLGIGVLGAGSGAALPFVFHGGGTTPGGGTSGGTPPGGGGGTTFVPTILNGTLNGDMTLEANVQSGVHAACAGSTQKYGENAVVNVNASGTGTITLNDTPGFQRIYNVTVTALNQAVTSQGSFLFFGAPIPGSMTATFTSATQMTLRETTTYGSCANTYSGTLTR
jgi:hypothetical protein